MDRLASASIDYQVLLELCRRDPDDEDLARARREAEAAMEVAWLEHGTGTVG